MRKGRFSFRPRVITLLIFFLLFGGVLGARLAYFQIGQHATLAARAEAEHWSEEQIIPRRGRIVDRDGKILASNIKADNVFVVPSSIKDPAGTAEVLSGVLGESPDRLLGLLSDETAGWVLLKRRLDPELCDRLEEMKLDGVYLENGTKRVYPNGSVASHLLGFANYDNRGAYGLEGAYDEIVGGEPGVMVAETDSAGNPIGIGRWEWKPPKEGNDLVLTLDLAVQHLVERKLDEALRDYKAEKGTVIVMDPETGAILAMASRPAFDPNRFEQTEQSLFKNPAISELFEPGSTFKIVTMAAGLATGTVRPDTTFECQGRLTVHGYTITNWDNRAHGQETMTDVLARSCNIGSSFVSTQLGSEVFYRYVKGFGFGLPTGIDLQGEESGIVKQPGDVDSGWTPIDLYTNSFGQGVSATPLQIAVATAAVANDGKMMRPHVVKQVMQDGHVVQEFQPEMVTQVIPPEVARTVTDMLVESVERGEARGAAVAGYRIAAKTGTAQIPSEEGYDTSATIGSTVLYAPAENPRFLVFVKLDRPGESPWGSQTAAPLAGSIARELLMYYRVPPGPQVGEEGA